MIKHDHAGFWAAARTRSVAVSCSAALPLALRSVQELGSGSPSAERGPGQPQSVDAAELLVGSVATRLCAELSPSLPRLARPAWLHRAGWPGPPSASLLSPQRVRLQAARRGLLHPLRVLAGRGCVEEVGGFPRAGRGSDALGGAGGGFPAQPVPLLTGPFVAEGLSTPAEDPGSGAGRGVLLGAAQKPPCAPCAGREPAPTCPAPC